MWCQTGFESTCALVLGVQVAEEAGTSRVGQEGLAEGRKGLAEAEVQNKKDPVEVVLEEALQSKTQDKAAAGLEARVACHRWAGHRHACDRSSESAGQTWAEAQMEWGRKGSSLSSFELSLPTEV